MNKLKTPPLSGSLLAQQPEQSSQQQLSRPGIVQLKAVSHAVTGKKPVAPPVYRPQPIPKVLQAKSIRSPQPQTMHPEHKTVAQPVYRPQPVLKVLQAKMPASKPPVNQARQTPAAPPVYRPQPPTRCLQPKKCEGQVSLPVAPPRYVPQSKLKVLQPKKAQTVRITLDKGAATHVGGIRPTPGKSIPHAVHALRVVQMADDDWEDKSSSGPSAYSLVMTAFSPLTQALNALEAVPAEDRAGLKNEEGISNALVVVKDAYLGIKTDPEKVGYLAALNNPQFFGGLQYKLGDIITFRNSGKNFESALLQSCHLYSCHRDYTKAMKRLIELFAENQN